MKLKARRYTSELIETEHELPIYLCFQDEDCHDELIMITEKEKTTIKHNHFGYTIEVSSLFHIEESDIRENSLTTKEHFEQELSEALDYLHKLIGIKLPTPLSDNEKMIINGKIVEDCGESGGCENCVCQTGCKSNLE